MTFPPQFFPCVVAEVAGDRFCQFCVNNDLHSSLEGCSSSTSDTINNELLESWMFRLHKCFCCKKKTATKARFKNKKTLQWYKYEWRKRQWTCASYSYQLQNILTSFLPISMSSIKFIKCVYRLWQLDLNKSSLSCYPSYQSNCSFFFLCWLPLSTHYKRFPIGLLANLSADV